MENKDEMRIARTVLGVKVYLLLLLRPDGGYSTCARWGPPPPSPPAKPAKARGTPQLRHASLRSCRVKHPFHFFIFLAFYYSCIKYSLSISHPSTTRWMRDTLLHSCLFSLLLHPLHFNFLCSYSHLLFNLPPHLLLSFPFSTIYLSIMHSHHLFLLFPPSSPSSLCKYGESFGRETENEWVGGEGWVSIRAAASSFHVVTNITQRLTGGNWLYINKRSWDLDRLPHPQSATGKKTLPARKKPGNCLDLWPLPSLSIPSNFTHIFLDGECISTMEENLLEFPITETHWRHFRHLSVAVPCKRAMLNIFPRLLFLSAWTYGPSLCCHAAATSKSPEPSLLTMLAVRIPSHVPLHRFYILKYQFFTSETAILSCAAFSKVKCRRHGGLNTKAREDSQFRDRTCAGTLFWLSWEWNDLNGLFPLAVNR